MRLISLADLITEVRRRADIENISQRFTDAEVKSYINASIAHLYSLLSRQDSTFYEKTTTFTTTNGTAAYDLSTLVPDFWVLNGVNISVSTNITFRAKKYMPAEGPWLTSIGVWGYGYPVNYRLFGNSITFAPRPTGTYTVTLEYTPIPQTLNEGDYFDGVVGFEEYVILDAAIKIKRKNNVSAVELMADLDKTEKWLESLASPRDLAEPERIQEVQSSISFRWP